ncbi:MAG: sugar ABC transporter permease [Chloroflexi bacterium]|nr:sugar ABC transporter permease [Chloroflexota bacterium]
MGLNPATDITVFPESRRPRPTLRGGGWRKRVRAAAGRVWLYRHLYLLALPGIIYLIIFNYIPMWGVIIAFKDFRLFKGLSASPWVGFKHFEFFFSSPSFPRLLRNTLVINGLYLSVVFPIPIILALLLNEVRHAFFKRFIQTISYLPHFISWVVVGGLLVYTFSQSMGFVNIQLARTGSDPLVVLGNRQAFLPLFVGTSIWKEVGWEAIIYLAAITGINPELYEAATVDGANRLQRVLHITIPGIIPVLVIMLILNVGSIMNVNFLQILILQGNDASLYDVSDVIDTWVYRAAFTKSQMSLATAVGLFKGIVGLVLVYMANLFARRVGETSLW